jgi:hypothetical protein
MRDSYSVPITDSPSPIIDSLTHSLIHPQFHRIYEFKVIMAEFGISSAMIGEWKLQTATDC